MGTPATEDGLAFMSYPLLAMLASHSRAERRTAKWSTEGVPGPTQRRRTNNVTHGTPPAVQREHKGRNSGAMWAVLQSEHQRRTTEAPSPSNALSAKSGTGSHEGLPRTFPSRSQSSETRTGFGAHPLITPASETTTRGQNTGRSQVDLWLQFLGLLMCWWKTGVSGARSVNGWCLCCESTSVKNTFLLLRSVTVPCHPLWVTKAVPPWYTCWPQFESTETLMSEHEGLRHDSLRAATQSSNKVGAPGVPEYLGFLMASTNISTMSSRWIQDILRLKRGATKGTTKGDQNA